MGYFSVKEMSKLWGISERRVRMMCTNGEIEGVKRNGRKYQIPANAMRPVDHIRLPRYIDNPSFRDLFEQIDKKNLGSKSLRPLTDAEQAALHEEFLVSFIYNSNAIEGNALSLCETALVLEGKMIAKKPLGDHLEVVGQRDAFAYIEELASANIMLHEREIKDIHSLVLGDRPQDKGKYRTIPVIISGAYTKPASPYEIEEEMGALIKRDKERKKKLHPLERIARFHLEFEGIHPFIDGNGRTGRLVMNLQLMQSGYMPINIKYADRKRYLEAFDAYFRDNDVGAMIHLVAGYVDERLNRYIEMLRA